MTIAPEIKDERERKEIIQIFQSLLTLYHRSFYMSQSFAIARSKVKSVVFLKQMGFEELSLNGEILPEVRFPQYNNEEYHVVIVKNDFSDFAYSLVERYIDLWEQKLVFTKGLNNQSQIASRTLQHSA